MSEPILYIDHSEVRAGKLEELKLAITELVAFVSENEPQLLSYNFYLDESGTRMTVAAMHPDPASLAFHMKVAGPAFRKFTDLITMSGIEVYGTLSEPLMEQIREKARLLGRGNVLVSKPHAGFSRFGA